MIKLELPLPPSINATYKSGKGVFYKSKESKKWAEDAAWIIASHGYGRPMIGMCSVSIRLDGLRVNADIDNRTKITLDALQAAGIIENDKLVYELHVYRGSGKAEKKAYVTVEKII